MIIKDLIKIIKEKKILRELEYSVKFLDGEEDPKKFIQNYESKSWLERKLKSLGYASEYDKFKYNIAQDILIEQSVIDDWFKDNSEEDKCNRRIKMRLEEIYKKRPIEPSKFGGNGYGK